MSKYRIEVEGIGKCYRIVAEHEEAVSLPRKLRNSFAYLGRMLTEPSENEILWALKDVSFKVREGEIVSIIGLNGGGKSTLLKILARVIKPTTGSGRLVGRVGSLLEVGTGFHPELTGRENVYLNGSVLGMPASEVRSKFDAIVDFSGIERFIDTPVKRYSSGMRVRLGFAVAAHLDVDVLLLDEVLAVGDIGFQQKCYLRISEMLGDGRTVMLVSHDFGRSADLASRAIWLRNGQLVMDGEFSKVLDSYVGENGLQGSGFQMPKSPDGTIEITKVELSNSRGETGQVFEPGETVKVSIFYRCHKPVKRPFLTVSVASISAPLFAGTNLLDGKRVEVLDGEGSFSVSFFDPPLMPGQRYLVRLAMLMEDATTAWMPKSDIAMFEVRFDKDRIGYEGDFLSERLQRVPPVVVGYEWEFPGEQRHRIQALRDAR